MSWFAAGALVVSAVGTGYSMYSQNKASKAAASVDTKTADYNAQLDNAQADQIQSDTLANIQNDRQNDAIYLSKQVASYAASGVLATTGSPLHAQITNAGKMEQQIQQKYSNAQRTQMLLHSQAAEGVYYGQAQSSADRAAGSLAMIDGGAKLAGMAFNAYNSGMFSGGSKSPLVTPSPNLPADYSPVDG